MFDIPLQHLWPTRITRSPRRLLRQILTITAMEPGKLIRNFHNRCKRARAVVYFDLKPPTDEKTAGTRIFPALAHR